MAAKIITKGIGFLSVVYVLREHCINIISVSGESMQPAICPGDLLITDRFTQKYKPLRAGEVVMFKNPTEDNLLCKRIHAVAGEPIVNLNHWQHSTDPRLRKAIEVPEGHIWVLGDNYSNSRDSRSFGHVPITSLHGRAVFRIWPISRIGKIPPLPKDQDSSPQTQSEIRSYPLSPPLQMQSQSDLNSTD